MYLVHMGGTYRLVLSSSYQILYFTIICHLEVHTQALLPFQTNDLEMIPSKEKRSPSFSSHDHAKIFFPDVLSALDSSENGCSEDSVKVLTQSWQQMWKTTQWLADQRRDSDTKERRPERMSKLSQGQQRST